MDQNELEAIKERYDRRKQAAVTGQHPNFSRFHHYIASEREFWYGSILSNSFNDLGLVQMLEVGAGGGTNLAYFRKLGIRQDNIWANELLPERLAGLETLLPRQQIFPGNALDLDFKERFDVIFQSTVFSSILDMSFRQRLAAKMWDWLRPGGLILWYDFIWNNPYNSDVRGVPIREVKSYFPKAKRTVIQRATLLPPFGRRVGRLYSLLNFPFLRSHIVAAFSKPD